jgi:hypothetical protein
MPITSCAAKPLPGCGDTLASTLLDFPTLDAFHPPGAHGGRPLLFLTSKGEDQRLAQGMTYEPPSFVERSQWLRSNGSPAQPRLRIVAPSSPRLPLPGRECRRQRQ